mmetsp:Transcript_11067/g.33345  ORF Transcript_11067/g.33345 Transcript_11067/m.33345 type:complete len:282 (+) Transcript_11067:262-1107(+)
MARLPTPASRRPPPPPPSAHQQKPARASLCGEPEGTDLSSPRRPHPCASRRCKSSQPALANSKRPRVQGSRGGWPSPNASPRGSGLRRPPPRSRARSRRGQAARRAPARARRPPLGSHQSAAPRCPPATACEAAPSSTGGEGSPRFGRALGPCCRWRPPSSTSPRAAIPYPRSSTARRRRRQSPQNPQAFRRTSSRQRSHGAPSRPGGHTSPSRSHGAGAPETPREARGGRRSGRGPAPRRSGGGGRPRGMGQSGSRLERSSGRHGPRSDPPAWRRPWGFQ